MRRNPRNVNFFSNFNDGVNISVQNFVYCRIDGLPGSMTFVGRTKSSTINCLYLVMSNIRVFLSVVSMTMLISTVL